MVPRTASCLAALLALAAFAPLHAEPARSAPHATEAAVVEPRAFGYVLGDVLTQHVLLGSTDDAAEQVAMPSAGRAGVWLERRPARVETGRDGRRWLVIDYQVTNAPAVLTATALPALTLTTPSGVPLHIGAWPISICPLTPDAVAGSGDLQPMRPDRLAEPAPIAQIERRLAGWLAALAFTLAAWALWWIARNRREAAQLPFARAWRQLRAAGESGADTPQAWRCLHRALDETAGRVVQAGSLTVLFSRAPWLEPLRASIEQFYRQSAARFFSTAAPGTQPAPFALEALARALWLAERRHRR